MSATIPRHTDDKDSFPRHLLNQGDTALVLFAAAFNGMQDAVWLLDAGLTATCIDNDEASLERMRELYPDTWSFVHADAFTFCREAARKWDIVTVDCPSNLFRKCADLIPLWCGCARDTVILGTGTTTEVSAPDGWQIRERRRRSSFKGGVYWDVLTRGTG